jgi:beta-lactamase class A
VPSNGIIKSGLSRRSVLAGLALIPSLGAYADPSIMLALEKSSNTRIGLSALDLKTNRTLTWRENEHFLMCSTSKLLVVGATLTRFDKKISDASQVVHYTNRDLMNYSPVTRKNLENGMSLHDLCEAAIVNSDNTAAVLLVRNLGGPSSVTQLVRNLGDATTRMDRTEPALNTRNGDLDTTTPLGMLMDLKALLFGNALSFASQNLLMTWLSASSTGLARLRAGLPTSWKIGDKTGSGAAGEANDVAFALPPGKGPILISAYTDKGSDALLAGLGRVVTTAFS